MSGAGAVARLSSIFGDRFGSRAAGPVRVLAWFCRTGSRFILGLFGESGRFCHPNPGGVIAPALGALVVPGARSRSGMDSALASAPALESD